jgi:hypothetical protein
MSEPTPRPLPSVRAQVVGSLVVAALIVALAIGLVTAKIGPGPDAREYRERQERIEEQREEDRDLQEELQEGG